METIDNFIGGTFRPAVSGEYIDNFEPATGKVYSRVADSDKADVAMAVNAARAAFPEWSTTPAAERSNILLKIAALITAHSNALALAESRDTGKPLKLARQVDIPRAAENFHFFATAILHQSNEAYQTDDRAINYTLRQPIGLAACISPWNLPIYLFTWKIAPALAAGNCVIAKPSELSPMTACMLAALCQEAGLPAGVLNIIQGRGNCAGEAIIAHPAISHISFTGGTTTGRHIAAQAALSFKRTSLELGGKNPNIIFEDCDWDDMMKTSLLSSFANQGQICLCGSRIFIHSCVYERFKEEFVDKTKLLKVGPPQESDTKIAALISKAHLYKVAGFVDKAIALGGNVLCGGKQVTLPAEHAGGYYYAPTVIDGLPYDCEVNQEEIFGPVVTLTPFDSVEEVLKMANSVRYGLAATIWTKDIDKANTVAQRIEAGIIWINCWLLRDLRTPFGGMKQSGVGREGGFSALQFFTEVKNICVKRPK